MYSINILLFEQFELLDAFGPAEIFGKDGDLFEVNYYSQKGGVVVSAQGTRIMTEVYKTHHQNKNVLVIPGGAGVRRLVSDTDYIDFVAQVASKSEYVLSVCTGSALLAKTNLLNGKEATSNKRAFEWVVNQNSEVVWVKKSRWVKDGNIYTSSGISAGMDMSLGFIRDVADEDKARAISTRIEYLWNDDSQFDPFSEIYG
jgi:putative intracellular protease/amidase